MENTICLVDVHDQNSCGFMRKLSRQDLIALADGAAIFSAGGGGAPEVGYKIVDALVEEKYDVRLVYPS